jgi:penicillin-binding protein 1A
MFGAVLSKLTGRSSAISGTSTITQQLARNAYLAEIKSQRSISRKLSEMFIAWRLENTLTKDEILEAYLNTIYLGYGNYGVSSAARTYFSKDVDDLTLAECAALAALPQAPDLHALITEDPEGNEEIKNINYYSLDAISDDDEEENDTVSEASGDEESEGSGYYANDISKERRDLVLDLMAEQGYIQTADAAEVRHDLVLIERVNLVLQISYTVSNALNHVSKLLQCLITLLFPIDDSIVELTQCIRSVFHRRRELNDCLTTVSDSRCEVLDVSTEHPHCTLRSLSSAR